MKIKLHSWYDHFTLTQTPKYIEWTKANAPIVFYSDAYLKEAHFDSNPNKCALLIEPRSIQPDAYEYIENNYSKFRYVFTHDSKLIEKLPNAKQIYWGGVYEFNDIPKTKDVSMVSSDKRMCDLHNFRMELAYYLEQYNVDCMGTFDGGKKVGTKTIYAPYRFSVVVENYIDDYWFSEKLCNCFANKTVPIYIGAKKINEIFDGRGIIPVKYEGRETANNVRDIITKMSPEFAYDIRRDFIEENYKRVKQFTCFEDNFYLQYKDLLEELENDSK